MTRGRALPVRLYRVPSVGAKQAAVLAGCFITTLIGLALVLGVGAIRQSHHALFFGLLALSLPPLLVPRLVWLSGYFPLGGRRASLTIEPSSILVEGWFLRERIRDVVGVRAVDLGGSPAVLFTPDAAGMSHVLAVADEAAARQIVAALGGKSGWFGSFRFVVRSGPTTLPWRALPSLALVVAVWLASRPLPTPLYPLIAFVVALPIACFGLVREASHLRCLDVDAVGIGLDGSTRVFHDEHVRVEARLFGLEIRREDPGKEPLAWRVHPWGGRLQARQIALMRDTITQGSIAAQADRACERPYRG